VHSNLNNTALKSANLSKRLTPENRLSILASKEAYWQPIEYRDTIASDLIYRAVLDESVSSVGDFERFVWI
jgi:hypothetical protein